MPDEVANFMVVIMTTKSPLEAALSTLGYAIAIELREKPAA
jgi:hypothetical protein